MFIIYAVRYFSRSLNFGWADIKSLKRTEPFNAEFVWPVDEAGDDGESLSDSLILVGVELLDDELLWWNGRL